jgi:hypothetical protein
VEKKNGLISFQSILTRKVEKANYKGQQQLLIIQTYQSGKFIDKDSSYCNAETLKPLAYFTDIQSEGHKERVTFAENEIENIVFFKDSITKNIEENKFLYNGVVLNDIITTMPLKANTKFLIKMVMPGLRYFEYTTEVEVLGKEVIEIPGIGKIKCWKIRTTSRTGSSSLEWYTVKGQVQIMKKFDLKNGDSFKRVMITGNLFNSISNHGPRTGFD